MDELEYRDSGRWPVGADGSGATLAHRIIVQGTKGSRAPLQVLPGFVLHETGNGFTPAAQDILRRGGALAMQAPA
jgi:hypothetical protein